MDIATERIRDIPFNEREVNVIISCANWMRIISYIFKFFAIINGLIGLIIFLISLTPKGNFNSAILSLIYFCLSSLPFLMGRWIGNSARSFMDVVNTTIDDQGFIIEGFKLLQRFFMALGIIIILIIAFIILALIYWGFTFDKNTGIL